MKNTQTFLKKEFDDAGYNTLEVVPGLLLVEDFISADEILKYFEIIDNVNNEDWSILYLKNYKIFCMDKFGTDDIDLLVKEGKIELTPGWDDKVLEVREYEVDRVVSRRLEVLLAKADSDLVLSGFGILQRMQPGVQLVSHTDQHTDQSIRYAAVLYINDNYSGGEIFFMNKQISMKPNAGSLLIFPGNDEFEHGVKHVKDGPIRYVLPGFIKIKDFYKKQ